MSRLKIVPRDTPRPCKKLCASCPFRKDSLKGMLGEYASPGEFIDMHYRSEVVNPCHETINYDDPEWRGKFSVGKMGRKCRGQAVFFANSLKLPRGGGVLVVEKDREAVFSWPHEFIKHHGGE